MTKTLEKDGVDITEQGEPCDACGDPNCADIHLCDVVLPDHPCPPGKNGDLARDQQGIDEVDLKTRLVARYAGAVGSWGQKDHAIPNERKAIFTQIVALGFTIPEAAALVGVSPEQGVRHFFRDMEPAGVLACEADLRAGYKPSFNALAKKHDLHREQVSRLCDIIDIHPELIERKRAGGSHRWTKAQIDEAHEMRAAGATYSTIGKHFDPSLDSAAANNLGFGIIRRNPRRPA